MEIIQCSRKIVASVFTAHRSNCQRIVHNSQARPFGICQQKCLKQYGAPRLQYGAPKLQCGVSRLQYGAEEHCKARQYGALSMHPKNHRQVHAAASAASAQPDAQSNGVDFKLIASVGLVLVLGVLNRVFNKLATVPMGEYLFFLAQVQTFGYVLFYGSILLLRRRAGKVTPQMLSVVDKKRFAVIGFLEAIAQVVSVLCVSKLPGVVIPLLSQTILLWQAALGYVVLGQRYTKLQLAGILLVVGGVAKAAWPSGASGGILGETNPLWAIMFSFAFLLLAGASISKDAIFRDAKEKLGGQPLDLFVVNTFGSTAQAGFVFLLLPVLCQLKNIPLKQLPNYLAEGCKAFMGRLPGTDGAPLIPLAYLIFNLTFNVAVLNLLRTSGAIVATLSLSALIPLTIFAFTFEWPLIGAAASLSSNFAIGTVMLMAGLLAYNWQSLQKAKTQ